MGGRAEWALNLFYLPLHACWPGQISIRWTTVWLFGVAARTKTATHVAVDRMGESWPFVLRASMTFIQRHKFKRSQTIRDIFSPGSARSNRLLLSTGGWG